MSPALFQVSGLEQKHRWMMITMLRKSWVLTQMLCDSAWHFHDWEEVLDFFVAGCLLAMELGKQKTCHLGPLSWKLHCWFLPHKISALAVSKDTHRIVLPVPWELLALSVLLLRLQRQQSSSLYYCRLLWGCLDCDLVS